MKKFIPCIMAAFLLLAFTPTTLVAVTHSKTVALATRTVESANANTLLSRLDEIWAMDRSSLNSSERKNLRKELRSLKSQLAVISGGIYISVGAVIVILLLLLLLL